jgi:osmoprotectant transport system permease protein
MFGGIRTSAVNVVATATLAPLAGFNSLGDPIINVSTYGDDGRLGAAVLVAFLAVATELSLAALQRATTPEGLRRRRKPMKQVRYATALIAVLLSALALGACGDDDDDDGGGGGGDSAAQIGTRRTRARRSPSARRTSRSRRCSVRSTHRASRRPGSRSRRSSTWATRRSR